MPSFKSKTPKKFKFCKKYTSTLDGKHKEMTNEFANNNNILIPKLKEERQQLKKYIKNPESYTLEEILDFKDKITEITETIRNLKSKQTNYYLDNSKYIFEYFENKKNIDNIQDKDNISKNQRLNNFFKIHDNDDKNDDVSEITNNNIVQKYLSNIDDSYLDMNLYVRTTDICQHCFKGEMIPIDEDGILICTICGVNAPYLIENEKPSYKEPPKEVCFYAYKKINHFKEILAQFQGKETTQIPDDVITQFKLQIEKERICLNDLNHYKTKEILKKLGFNKYYEHIAFIKNKLGIKPPVFSNGLEETLCNLFMEIQTPYAKTSPDHRVNFLNYYYVLYKFCELLGEDQYLADIPKLKDREKLIEQDETWQKMCIQLDWEFLPTI